MQKSNFKKLSLLGLVLMGASAITAAMLPKEKTDDSKLVQNGEITSSLGDGINNSCRTRDVVNGNLEAANCFDTDSQASEPQSDTSEGAAVTSGDTGGMGDTNTTLGDNS